MQSSSQLHRNNTRYRQETLIQMALIQRVREGMPITYSTLFMLP
jgi:hypothetical protein